MEKTYEEYFIKKIYLLESNILNLEEKIHHLEYRENNYKLEIDKLERSNNLLQNKLITLLDEKESNKLNIDLLEIHGGILGRYTKD